MKIYSQEPLSITGPEYVNLFMAHWKYQDPFENTLSFNEYIK